MKLILDAGGVLVYPAFGSWRYGAAMMTSRIADTLGSDAYLRAHAACVDCVREDVRIDTEAEEFGCRRRYFERMNALLPWNLSAQEIDFLARDFVENTRRMGVYPDAAQYLPRWRKHCGLGLLSDTMPSLERVLRAAGLWEFFDAHVFSTDVGALKPAPVAYARIAELLRARPEECLFVDDMGDNLRGAQRAGMRAVQMARDECTARWDGPVVRDFAELDAYVGALS